MLNPEKIRHQQLAEICPPRLSDVATLPLEIQKSFSTALKHSLEAVSHAEPMQNLHRRGHSEIWHARSLPIQGGSKSGATDS